MATIFAQPVAADTKEEFLLKSKMGFLVLTFGDLQNAREYKQNNPDRRLKLVKRTIIEEEIFD